MDWGAARHGQLQRSTGQTEMTIPQEFRMSLITAYLLLTLLGIGYNKLVDQSRNWKWAEGLTSFSVVFGCSFVLGILNLFFHRFTLPFWAVIVIVFGGLACAGAPMIIGQRMRYARLSRLDEEAVKNHRPRNWPSQMLALRNAAGEEAMSGARVLADLKQLPAEQDAKVSRARGCFIKIAALMARAGAPIKIETL